METHDACFRGPGTKIFNIYTLIFQEWSKDLR